MYSSLARLGAGSVVTHMNDIVPLCPIVTESSQPADTYEMILRCFLGTLGGGFAVGCICTCVCA